MSPVRVTHRLTCRRLLGMFTTALATAFFLSAAAALFAFNLDGAEGTRTRIAPLWALSVAPFLPILAAILGMDVWSEERKSGRIELLLATPVPERDFVIGKFLGVWQLLAVNVALSLISTMAFLKFNAPALLDGVGVLTFIPAFAALLLQGALWCAATVAFSSFFRYAAAAAVASILVLCAIPRGIWMAFMVWSGKGRPQFCEFPADAHAFDMSSGLFASSTVALYILLAVFALFVSVNAIKLLRFSGKGGAPLRRSTGFAIFLAAVCTALAIMLSYRIGFSVDFPMGGGSARFSARTRSVLAESRGTVVITLFVERKDSRFREVAHFLRALSAEADAMCGVKIELRYVDPLLDIGAAQRLASDGVSGGSLVFEYGGRTVGTINIDEGYGERACISIIERVSMPFRHRSVYWTTGHGEASISDYGVDGLSDIVRELALDGFGCKTIDLAGKGAIDDDCALIVVAGPRNDFSAVELARLRSYLEGRGGRNEGGRLLALVDSVSSGGIAALLAEWGIRPVAAVLKDTRTLSATDVIVSDFSADNPVSRPFDGQQVVLDRPVAFVQSAAADEPGKGADRKVYSELIRAGGACLAALAERGDESGDLAIRPTRIVAIGDLSFVQNGLLGEYANANRDFFLNAVRYLAGRDALTQSGTEPGVLVSGMDRSTRAKFAMGSVAAFPLLVLIALCIRVIIGRRR